MARSNSILDDLNKHSLGNKNINNPGATPQEEAKSASSILSELDSYSIGKTNKNEEVAKKPKNYFPNATIGSQTSNVQRAINNGATYGNMNGSNALLDAVSNGINGMHNAIQNMPTNVSTYGNKYGTTLGIKSVDNAIDNLGTSGLNGFRNFASGIGRVANDTILNTKDEIRSTLGLGNRKINNSFNDSLKEMINEGIVSNNKKVIESNQEQAIENEKFQNNFSSDTAKQIAKIANDVEQSIGNMAPQIASTVLTGGALGMLPLWFGSYGGSLVDKTDANGNVSDKEKIRALMGANIEVATEMMFGLNKYFGGTEGWGSQLLKKTFGDKLVDFMGRKLGKNVASLIYDQIENALGEGAEEFIGQYMNAYVDNVLDNNNWNVFDILNDENKSEAFYSAMIGALTGIIMEIPTLKGSYNEATAKDAILAKSTEAINNASNTVNEILSSNAQTQGTINNAQNNVNATQNAQTNNLYDTLANNLENARNEGNNANYNQNRVLSKEEAIATGKVSAQEYDKYVNWAKNNGVDVVVINNPNANYNGYYNNDVVTINLASQNKFADIWRHEMFHSVEDTQLGKDLANYVRENYQKFGYTQEDIENGTRFASESGLASEQNADNELVARFLEQFLGDEEVVSEMSQANPSLFQRIWNWIKQKLGLMKQETLSEEQQILRNMNEMFENAVNNRLLAQNSQYDVNFDGNLDPQISFSKNDYQVVELSDGNEALQFNNIDFGKSPTEHWSNILSELEKRIDNAPDKFSIMIKTDDGIIARLSKKSFGEYVFGSYNKKNQDNAKIKMNLKNNIDDIIENSKGYTDEPRYHKAKDGNGELLAKDGFKRSSKIYIADKKGQVISVEVLLGKRLNNSAKYAGNNFYDIVGINKEATTIIGPKGMISNVVTSKNILSDNNGNVNNTEFSKNLGKNYNEVSLPTMENATSFYSDILSQPDFKALAIYDNTLTSKKPIADLVNNPSNYSLEDAKRALKTIDKDATFDGLENYSDEEAKGAIIEAIKDSEYEGMDFDANDPNGERGLTTVIVPSFEQNRPNSFQVSHFMTEQGRPVYHDVIDNTSESIQNSLSKTLPVDDGNGYVARVYTDDTQFSKNLSTSNVDSEGNSLTKEQQTYFKNSKVRDDNGILKVMYHGTQNDFNIFDTNNFGGKNGTQYGYGIYLTDDVETTKLYGDRLIKSYVNMKRPMTETELTLARNEIFDLVKALSEKEASQLVDDGEYDDINEAIRDSFISNITYTRDKSINQVFNEVTDNLYNEDSSDAKIVWELMTDMGIRNYKDANSFYKTLTDVTGIDGYILENADEMNGMMAIAFNSNQIKNVDNQNPTSSDDIRYSKGNTSFSDLIEEARKRYKDISTNEKVTSEDTQVVEETKDLGILNQTKAKQLAKELRSIGKAFGINQYRDATLKEDIQTLISECGNGGMTQESIEKYVSDVIQYANDYGTIDKVAISDGWLADDELELYNAIKGTKINKNSVPSGERVGKWNSHGIKLVNEGGVDFDSWVNELMNDYPGLLGETNGSVGDNYKAIINFMDNVEPDTKAYMYNQFGTTSDELMKQEVASWIKNEGTLKDYTQEAFSKRQVEFEEKQARNEQIKVNNDARDGLQAKYDEDFLYQYGSEEEIEEYERNKAINLNKEYKKAVKKDNLSEALKLKRDAIKANPKEFGVNMTADMFSHLTDETQNYLAKTIMEADERGNTNFHTMAEDKRRTRITDNLVNQNEWANLRNEKIANRATAFRTQERNAVSLFGDKDGKWINDNFVKPVHDHEATSIRNLNSIKEKMGEKLQYIYDNYDKEVDSFLDGKITESQLLEATDEKAVEIAKEMRKAYDDKYEEINRALIDNGMDPILYTMTYTPHLQDVQMTQSNFIDSLKLAFDKVGFAQENDTVNLSTVNGVYEQERKFTRNGFFALKSREGQQYTNTSATMKFESYMRNAEKVINHTQDIQNFKSLAETVSGNDQQAFYYKVHQLNDELQQGHIGATEFTRRFNQLQAEHNSNKVFPVQASWAQRYSELLATGTTKYVNDALGGKYFRDNTKKTFNRIQGTIARNMVAFNITSGINNLQPFIQANGMVSQHNLIRGMQEAVSNTIQNDGYTYKSSFLTNLYGSESMFDYGQKESVINLGFKFMEAVDHFTKPAIHRAFYYDAIENGMSEEKAIKYADDKTSSLVADRSYASMPEVFYSNSPLMKMLTTFQLEQMNIFEWYTKDLPKFVSDEDKKKIVERLMRAFIGTSVSAFLYNLVMKNITGYKNAFSPIDNVIDIYNELQSDDDNEKKAKEVIGIGVKDVPVLGTAFNNYFDTNSATGSYVPVQAPLPSESNINHVKRAIQMISDENVDEQTRNEYLKDVLVNDLSKTLYLAPGGSQARKTIRGLDQFIEGKNDTYGYNKYYVDQNPLNLFRSVVGGPSAVSEAQDYYSRPLRKSYMKAQEIEKDYDFSIDEFYEIYDDVRGIKATTKNGKTVSNSASLQKRKVIDENIKDTKLRKELYDAFDVSKTVQGYDYSKFLKEYKSKVGK